MAMPNWNGPLAYCVGARGRGGQPLHSGHAAGLLQSRTPKLLVWGEDDPFQTVDYAERHAREIPETRLVRIKSAGHIPMENDPKAVAGALAEFLPPNANGRYR